MHSHGMISIYRYHYTIINNTNMKKFAWKKCRKMFLEALFFAFEKNFFRVSVQNFGHCRLHEIIDLQLSQCLSANHNPELRCVICTGVTLFALVLHLNCTALSQSESSNFFMCIIMVRMTSTTAKFFFSEKCNVVFQLKFLDYSKSFGELNVC